jgi:tetratricopeptide (TPR) repeat protein
MEAVVLLTVVVAPWAFGCVHPLPQLFLAGSLAGLLALWAARIVLDGRLRWANCPVFFCLAGLFLLGVLQVTALPGVVLEMVSPATVELRRDLLPVRPEQITVDEPGTADRLGSNQPISVYSGATRAELLGWLALIALFVVVRHNLTSPEFMRRLAVVAAVNGALLALFGMLQFFSSPRHMLYWSVPSRGAVFGPFVNRNHFACYVNLCVGLAVGLLLGFRSSQDGTSRRNTAVAGSRGAALLLRPQTLAVGLALTLMLASVAICLSRGALVALAAAGLLCLTLSCRRTRQSPRVWGPALVCAAAAGLVGWLALPAVQARLATLWRGDALHDDRLELWTRLLTLCQQFPVWGTGYGTLPYVEPLARAPGEGRNLVYEYADNDYVQLLIEGGGVGLLLAVVATSLVYYRGGRAYLNVKCGRTAGLVLGGLFAWTTVTVHSFFSYGLHVPAIAVLAAVIAAQLVAAGEKPSAAAKEGSSGSRVRRSLLLRPVVLLGVVALLAVGFVLVTEAWRAARVERYRLAAESCRATSDPAALERRQAYLEAAVALAPGNALLHLELAEVHHDAFERGGRRARDAHLKAALVQFVQARDLCPLLGHCQVRLATYAGAMARADGRDVYLRRAVRLMPDDERLWFVCGARALTDGRPEDAWVCWRRSLECSPRYLGPVLTQSYRRLAPAELVSRVLPADPLLLWQAAHLLADMPVAGPARLACLEAALGLFEQRQGALSGREWHGRARCHQALGQADQAMQAYREALSRNPDQAAWRYEFVELLVERAQLQEARRELRALLEQDPNHAPARDLYQKVVQRTAEGG